MGTGSLHCPSGVKDNAERDNVPAWTETREALPGLAASAEALAAETEAVFCEPLAYRQ